VLKNSIKKNYFLCETSNVAFRFLINQNGDLLMPKPSYHILVCTNSRPPGHPRGSCTESGSNSIFEKLSMGVDQKGLFGKCVVTSTGCLGPCGVGPVLVVYPDGVWYQKVQPEDVDEILDQHIAQGKKVNRLEVPDELWG
jgi:(2Fe-2S) ferredoxin